MLTSPVHSASAAVSHFKVPALVMWEQGFPCRAGQDLSTHFGEGGRFPDRQQHIRELRDTMSDLVVPPAGQPAPSSWLCPHGCSSQSASYQRQQEVPPGRAERGFQRGSLPGRRGYRLKLSSYSPSLAASEYPLLQARDPATLQVFLGLFSCPLLLLCSDRQWQP